jgi:hypothetical protein
MQISATQVHEAEIGAGQIRLDQDYPAHIGPPRSQAPTNAIFGTRANSTFACSSQTVFRTINLAA